MNETIEYYNLHAADFAANTRGASMHEMADQFLEMIPAGGRVLDLGCGSGRDSLHFMNKGYQVSMVDGSPAMCREAEKLTGLSACCSDFLSYQPEVKFDGIWACASLLHLPHEKLPEMFRKLADMMNRQGILYASFKYGMFEGERSGRYFTDLTEEKLEDVLKSVSDLAMIRMLKTKDVRPDNDTVWLNAFLQRKG